jgi:hypothetical protein
VKTWVIKRRVIESDSMTARTLRQACRYRNSRTADDLTRDLKKSMTQNEKPPSKLGGFGLDLQGNSWSG